jgi:hypothetical protein
MSTTTTTTTTTTKSDGKHRDVPVMAPERQAI